MKIKDLKIGTKLYGGFITLLVLTLLVGVIAYNGISRIVYQIDIAEAANRIIVDGGDVQAGSLRYIIYKDDSYFELIQEESNNIIQQAEDIKEKLLSSDNKRAADEITRAIKEYEQHNNNYYKLSKEKEATMNQLMQDAQSASDEIAEVIEIAASFSRQNQGDYSAVERVFMVQESRDALNRVRIVTNRYLLNPSDALENELKNEMDFTISNLEQAHSLMVSENTKNAIDQALSKLEEYQLNLTAIKDITRQQEEINMAQHESAEGLLTEARELRNGVFAFIGKQKASALRYLVGVLLLAIILGLIIGTTITRGITIPLSKSVDFATNISNGDLRGKLEIEQKDEVGVLAGALQDMKNKLMNIVSTIKNGA
ncbi:MAG: methyl-accepting chemotaxis protein, partial [Bacteroidota bacterium]